MGKCDTKVGDWVGCFPPGGQSLNYNLGNHDNCKGKCSGQTHKQTNKQLLY